MLPVHLQVIHSTCSQLELTKNKGRPNLPSRVVNVISILLPLPLHLIVQIVNDSKELGI